MARDIPGYYFGLLIDVPILTHQASHLQLTVCQIPRKANISRLSQTMLYQVQPSTRNRQSMHGGLPSRFVERSPATTRGVLADPVGLDLYARALVSQAFEQSETSSNLLLSRDGRSMIENRPDSSAKRYYGQGFWIIPL